jgi:hypothetical protein
MLVWSSIGVNDTSFRIPPLSVKTRSSCRTNSKFLVGKFLSRCSWPGTRRLSLSKPDLVEHGSRPTRRLSLSKPDLAAEESGLRQAQPSLFDRLSPRCSTGSTLVVRQVQPSLFDRFNPHCSTGSALVVRQVQPSLFDRLSPRCSTGSALVVRQVQPSLFGRLSPLERGA